MNKHSNLLERCLSQQVALEEQLYKVIAQQVSDVDEAKFPDAKNLLLKARDALEQHFTPLNIILDDLDRAALSLQNNPHALNLPIFHDSCEEQALSELLRNDYAALNHVAIGNSMLHTIALALDRQEVAAVALSHLQHLTPLVEKLEDLIPYVVTQELLSHSQ